MSIPNAPGDDAEPAAASATTDADFDFSRSPHDQFFKSSLRRPEVAADLLAHYLPPEVVALLDLGSLELQEGSFIDDHLREQQSDLLFRARLLAGGETYIYLLFEHKSFVYHLTPFQVLRYQVRIWEDDIRLAGRRVASLCPIIPIVVYHGKRRWTAPLSLSGLFRSPPALAPFLPEQRYVLLDLQAWKKEEIIGGLLLRVTLLVLQAIFRPGLPKNLTAIAALLRQLTDQVLREQELSRLLAYATYSGQGLSVTEIADVAQAVEPERGGAIAMTLAEKLRAEGRLEGLTLAEKRHVEGRAEGLHQGLEALLDARFGDAGLALLPEVERITDIDRLQALLEAVRHAETLDGVRQTIRG
ncbi:MAG TPA: Rpn family recombination-promoting nuclease/putative transposase [Anaerolineae bacterium]|nr:Rpn family recombination-promoting nuclease/putative transposase [Anaerolineae bacterium]